MVRTGAYGCGRVRTVRTVQKGAIELKRSSRLRAFVIVNHYSALSSFLKYASSLSFSYFTVLRNRLSAR